MKILATVLVAVAAASAQTTQPVLFKTGTEIMDALTQKAKTKVKASNPTNINLKDGYRILFVRRDVPGEPIVHAGSGRKAEFHYIVDGTATLVTGGTIQGGSIEGGVPHVMKQGDAMFVPDGVAHWYKEASHLTYLEVSFEPPASAQQPVIFKTGAEMEDAIRENAKAKAKANNPTNPSTRFLVGDDYYIAFIGRDVPGIPLLHVGSDKKSEFHYIIDGTATMVIGGKNVDGKTVEGGETHLLTKGDAMFVPDGVSHWYKEAGPVRYIEIGFKR